MDEKICNQIIEDMFLMFPLMRSAFLGKCDTNNEECSKLVHSKYHALGMLSKRGPMQMSEIGNKIGISKPNMTSIINSLIKEGKVKRTSSQNDRRIIVIEITTEGKYALLKARDNLKRGFKKKLALLNSQEMLSLSNSLSTTKTLVLKMIKGVNTL